MGTGPPAPDTASPQRTWTDGSPRRQLGAVLSVSCRGLVWALDPLHGGRGRAHAVAVYPELPAHRRRARHHPSESLPEGVSQVWMRCEMHHLNSWRLNT